MGFSLILSSLALISGILRYSLCFQVPIPYALERFLKGVRTLEGRCTVRLVDMSSLAHQLDNRLATIASWVLMWRSCRRKAFCKNDRESLRRKLQFWSSVFQVVVDMCIGLALGVCLQKCSSSQFFAFTNQFIPCSQTLRVYTAWMMGLPANMKLNVELNTLLGSIVLYFLELNTMAAAKLVYLEPLVLRLLPVLGVFGGSMMLSFIYDIVALRAVHLWLIHFMFCRIFYFMRSVLSSLSKLFRGKKRNVLRNRIDSCQYDMDQLVVGTIFFTLAFFLFPTVTIYYAFFCCTRLCVLASQSLLWLLLALLEFFPFYVSAVSLFDRGQFPGGIRLQPPPLRVPLSRTRNNSAHAMPTEAFFVPWVCSGCRF